MGQPFEPSNEDAIEFIRHHPLATITSGSNGAYFTTPVPLIFDGADTGCIVGHFARANPHVEALRKDGRAVAVILGPHGYISPSWMEDRTQAPTWNYQICTASLEIALDDRRAAADDAVGRLTSQMEHNRQKSWAPEEMRTRYEKLIRGVIAFKARIVSLEAKFKLGQNEREGVFEDICAGLTESGDTVLASLMQKYRA